MDSRNSEGQYSSGFRNNGFDTEIVENSPYVTVLFDDKFNVVDCNSEAVRFFGFVSKEEFLEGFLRILNESIPDFQRSGRKSLPLSERLSQTVENGEIEFFTELFFAGKAMPANVTFKRLPYGESFVIAAFLNMRSESETRLRVMLDSTPLACVFLDDNHKAVDCNLRSVRLFEMPSKEECVARYSEFIPEHQPDGTDSHLYLRVMVDEAFRSGNAVFDFTYRLVTGEMLPVELTVVRVDWRDTYLVLIYARDMRALKDARRQAEHRSRLLQAVNTVATNLVSTEAGDFDGIIMNSLRLIGRTVDVDRVYIWENFVSGGKLCARQIYEWSENAEAQQGKDFTIYTTYDEVPLWHELVMNNRILNCHVCELPENERQILEHQKILSILMIPIHFNGNPWGFIGFDDCRTIRTFTEAEEQLLRAGGTLLTSAIQRNDMMRRLIGAGNEQMRNDKLLRAVNAVANLLLETDQDDFMETVHQALMTLGMSVDADLVALWRNLTDDKAGLCADCMCNWISGRTFDRVNPFERILLCKGGSEDILRVDTRFLVSDAPEFIKSQPIINDYTSLMHLPVILHGDFWGFIGFAFIHEERPLSGTEKNILRSGGMMIASAKIRNEITESLVEARENALASTRAKSEFLSRMSHEIRTPMNAIIGMTSLALKCGDEKKLRHYLYTVESSSRQLLAIINDVLDMSKIDANKLEIMHREFDFDEMIRHVVNVVQVKMDEKKQVFRLDMPRAFSRFVVSDELRLSQVLLNLLSNAVKFTPEQGEITLRVRETPLEDGRSMLRMEVEDNGIGIAQEYIPNIFNSFEQGDGGVTRQYGGTGLGLAICKRIAVLMEGDIWVESNDGKGTCFKLDIPVGWGAAYDERKRRKSLDPNMKILVVDDAPDVLEFFRHVLDSFSLSCDVAEGGRKAVELAAESVKAGSPYDVVFLDWFMPDMNGGQTACAIKEVMGEHVAVIMISTADWSDIEQEAVAAGVSIYLPKPIMSSDLFNILVSLSQGRGDPDTAGADANPVHDWSDKCILLAEDIEINRDVVAGMLEETGVCIENAENGRQAVDMFLRTPDRYNLVLMDVQMPVLDGLSATREIRKSSVPNARDIPIIAMTANAFKEDEQASLEAGMNGHLTKPLDPEEAIRVISSVLDL